MRIIPIIEPYKAGSVDRGKSWILEFDIANTVVVAAFGVSKNFIYGRANDIILHGQKRKGWFLFDVNSTLLAIYPTKAQLITCLQELNAPINDIVDCNEYYKRLTGGKDLYWYPTGTNKYPSFPAITPKDITEVNVVEPENGSPDFFIKRNIRFHKNNIYFFNIHYNKKQNKKYYFTFNYQVPFLAKDSLLPVYIDSNKFEVTLYTPVPVAEELKIAEKDRYEKTKSVSVSR